MYIYFDRQSIYTLPGNQYILWRSMYRYFAFQSIYTLTFTNIIAEMSKIMRFFLNIFKIFFNAVWTVFKVSHKVHKGTKGRGKREEGEIKGSMVFLLLQRRV